MTADEFIYQRLTADAALQALVGTRIYRDLAPISATTYPMIVFSYTTGDEAQNGTADKIMDIEQWDIRCIDYYKEQPSYARNKQVLNRVRDVLHKTSDANGIVSCAAVNKPVEFSELADNGGYCHSVRTFEICTQ